MVQFIRLLGRRRLKRFAVVGTCLLCWSLAGPAQAEDSAIRPPIHTQIRTPQQILADLQFATDQEVPFRQRQLNPLLKRISEQHGLLSISAEHGFVMRIVSPRAEERRLANGVITLQRTRAHPRHPHGKVVTRQISLDATHPNHLVLLAMESLLLGDIQRLQQHFAIQPMTASSGWVITLTPTDNKVRKQLSRVLLFGEAEHLTRFRSERDGSDNKIRAWVEIEIAPSPEATATAEL